MILKNNVLRDVDTSGYTDVEHVGHVGHTLRFPSRRSVPASRQRCPRLPDNEQGLEQQLELGLRLEKKGLCTSCGIRERYNESATMDWCEPCIWEYVRDDPTD
jgi:hypothetical protein